MIYLSASSVLNVQHERFHALSDKKPRNNPAFTCPLFTPFPRNVNSPLSLLFGSWSLY